MDSASTQYLSGMVSVYEDAVATEPQLVQQTLERAFAAAVPARCRSDCLEPLRNAALGRSLARAHNSSRFQ